MKKNFTPHLPLINLLTGRYFCRRSFFLSLVFFLLFFCVSISAFAQPTVLGTQAVNGGYVTYDLNTVGGFKQKQLQATSGAATGVRNWEFATGTAASTNYTTNWRPYTVGQTLSATNTFIDPATATASARYNTSSGGQSGLLPVVTANNYYAFNVSSNISSNNNMSVLETSYNPESITAVTQSPVASNVSSLTGVIINITTSVAPNANVFVRYSTDNFVTSTIVLASFIGTNGTATIPAQPANTVVRYYVYNSPETKAQIDADVSSFGQGTHDMATLNLNNNSGSNYSYTVLPVTVNATNSANDASYATLSAAFTQINAGTHMGVINVYITGNTTETATATLNATGGSASYTSIIIQPSGGAARTITGAIMAGSPLVSLNGATNLNINGLNSGGNSLSFSNTTASATAGTSTILFNNSATSNTIQNCTISGSSASASDGTIEFGVTGNNSSNTISANTINAAGASLPLIAVYSAIAGANNNTISITGNNIQDYYNAAAASIGVSVGGNCSAWTISNNRFFQTASRSASITHKAIQISNISGGNFTISGNIIGYGNSSQSGLTIYTSGAANRFVGIELNVAAAPVSNVQGNTIAGITLSTSSGASTTNGIFTGIYVIAGNVNIGTTTGNIIGVPTTGPISITSSTSTPLINFISVASGSCSIQNNTVTAISVGGTVGYTVNGIATTGTGAFTISSNTIGSGSVASSIVVGAGANSATCNFVGINNTATGAVTISGNTIGNAGLSLAAATSGSITGISFVTASGLNTSTITVNTINTLTANNNPGVIQGISANNNGATNNMSRNKIFDLSGSGNANTVNGIICAGGVGSIINISNNIVGDLRAPNLTGTATPNFSIQGININTGASINVNIYYNSVWLSATASLTTNFGTVALYTSTGPILDLRNNILVNVSTPRGTGRTVAYQRNSTTIGTYAATSNNNLFYAGSPSASNLIFYDGTNSSQTLSAFQTLVTPRDNLSVSINPAFLSTVGSNANFLHIDPTISSLIESGGAQILGYVDDFDALGTRPAGGYPLPLQVNGGGTAPDIGADEYDGKPLTNYTWNGNFSNSWNLNTNWTPNGIPGASDAVTLTNGAPNNLVLASSVTVAGITFNGAGSFFTINAGASITVTGSVTYTAGSGAWDCASTFTMSSAIAQSIPPMNFGNLIVSGGARTFVSAATTGICGNYTPGTSTTATGSTVQFNGTTAQSMTATCNFATLNITNTSATVTSNGSLTVATALNINATAILVEAVGVNTLTISGATVNVNGTLRNSSSNDIAQAGATVTVGANGTYDHNRNGANGLLIASWSVGSNCLISGVTATAPVTNLGQAFSDFTWNCAQTGSVNFNISTFSIGRDFTVQNTGGFNLGLSQNTILTMTVGRNMSISGSSFVVETIGTANSSVTVSGNLSISGGGFTLANSASSGGTVSLSVTGTVSNTSSSGTSLVLTASSKAATMTIGNGYSQNNTPGTVSFVQGTGAGTMNITGGDFTLTAGNFYLNNATTGTGVAALNHSNASGNFNVNGGTLNPINQASGTPTARPTITISGNFVQTNGNIDFAPNGNFAGLNPVGEILVAKNFTRSGAGPNGYIRNTLGINNAQITFNGITQTYNTTGLGANFTYTNIVINNTSSVTMSSDITLSNTTTPAQTVTVNGTLTCGTNTVTGVVNTSTAFVVNGTLSMGSPNGITTTPTASGNIQTGTRTFNTTANYIYAGAANQVTGSGLPATVGSLTIANTGISPNNVVTLTNTLTVTNAITLTSGILDLTTLNITVGNTSGGSTTTYVRTSSTGQMKRVVGASATFFPVGNSAYNPITLNNSGISDTYGIRVSDGAVATANNPNKCVNRRWFVAEAVSGNSNLSVVSQYNTGEEAVNFNAGTTPYIGFYNGSLWSQQAATLAGGNPFTFTSNTNFNLAALNLTAASTYYFADGKDDAFTCSSAPTITSFTPTTAYTGDMITVTGTNLSGITSATFGGVTATINSTSPTSASITVGAGANGNLFVASGAGCYVTSGGTLTYSGYISAQTGNWSVGSTWRGGNVPVTLNAVTINTAHNVTVDALANPSTLIINATGTLTGSDDTKQMYLGSTGTGTITNNGTITLASSLVTTAPAWLVCGTLINGNGSIFNNNCGNAGAVAVTTFTLNSGSTYNHNAVGSSLNGAIADFPGLTGGANITINSNATVNITKWAQNNATGPNALPTIAGGQWGNLTINITGQTYLGSWQNSGGIANATSLSVANTGGFDFRLTTMNGSAYTANIGTINVSGTGILSVINGGSSGSNSATVNISGNVNISGGSMTLTGGATGNNFTTGTNNLNISGNLNITGGTLFGLRGSAVTVTYGNNTNNINVTGNTSLTNGSINFGSFTSYTVANTQTVNLNLNGDFSVNAGASLLNTNFAKTTGNIVFNRTSGMQAVTITPASGINTNPLFFTAGAGSSTNIVSLNTDFPMNSTTSTLTVLSSASLYCNTGVVSGNIFTLNSGGTLGMGSTAGISNSGATGNVQTTTRNFNASGNYIYNSSVANQITGNSLPLTITSPGTLTIANTGTAPNNIVTLTTNNTTTPRLNLNAGQFNAGTGGTLLIAVGGIVNGGGGNQLLSGASTDNIIQFVSNGAVQNTPELYNVTIGNSGGGVDFTNNARINGILLINSNGSINPNSPKYAVGSTLIYNSGGSYTRNIEWGTNTALAPSYPHYVIIRNATNLIFDSNTPAAVGCGGDLTIGNPSAADAGTLDLTLVDVKDLYVGGNLNIGGLSSTSTLNMSNTIGGDIYLTGNWNRNANGTVNFGAGNGRAIFFEGAKDATITANGGQTFPYVFINKSAKVTKVTLADNVNISYEINFTKGTVDLGTNNKFLTILSSSTITGRVGPSDPVNTDFIYGAGVTGQFIVQRYVPARRSWRLMAAPLKPGAGTHSISEAWQERGNGVDGLDYTAANYAASIAADTITTFGSTLATGFSTHITGGTKANGFDLSPTNNPGIKYYSSGSWLAPTDVNNTSINSKEGWMLFVRGDRKGFGEITNQYKTPTITTLRPRGQIFIGSKSVTATGTSVVGNPYASAADYFSMVRTGAGWPSNPTYYVWDPYLGGATGQGAFVTLTWNTTNLNFDRSNPLSTVDNRYIPSGAAIMIDFPAGSGTLIMNETDKNTANTTQLFRPVRGQLGTVLNTVNPDNSTYVTDGALLIFGNDFNNGVDIDDAAKLTNFAENFGLQRNGKILSVERRKTVGDADTIFYSLQKMQAKKYQLQFVMDDPGAPASTAAFLEDLYLKKKTPVNMQDTTRIDFDITTNEDAQQNRFRLVFKRSVKYANLNAFVLNSDIAVTWKVEDELNINHYEIERSSNGISFTNLGSKLSNGNSESPVNYSWLDAGPQPGEYFYRIKSISNNGVVAYSDVVKVTIVKGSPDLYVFPNPASGNAIQLQMNGKPAGQYSIRLINSLGQPLLTNVINHAGGTATHKIAPDKILVSGMYQLEVTSPDKNTNVIKVMVSGQ